jgi:hypothetical protein
VDQHPVARPGARAVVVEQADVDRPLDAGDVDLREAVGLVNDLDDPAWDGQAHRRSPLRDRARVATGR